MSDLLMSSETGKALSNGSSTTVTNAIESAVAVPSGSDKTSGDAASSTTLIKHTRASLAAVNVVSIDQDADAEKILQFLRDARKRELAATADIPRCGRFPRSTVCGCNIPCRKAMSQVTLDEVRPRLFIGSVQTAYLDQEHKAKRIVAVVNASNSLYEERKGVHYLKLPLQDTSDFDISPWFSEVNRFISRFLEGGNGVLVHCRAGKSRSAILCAAFLVEHDGFDADAALTRVRERHPRADPNSGFVKALSKFALDRKASWTQME